MLVCRLIQLCVLGLAVSAASAADPTRADWQDAAKELIAATVSVEMESADRPATGESEPLTVFASGTVVSEDGLIVTTDIADAEDATWRVRLRIGETLEARTVAVDRRSRLRLLHVEGDEWKPLAVAEENVAVGQQVATLAVDQSRHVRYVRKNQPRVLSVGLITAIERQVEDVAAPLIQTDLRAGMGSAGSPVVNQEGKLVGIIFGSQGKTANEGAMLAIPARYLVELLELQRREETVVVHPAYLGVQLATPKDGEGAEIARVFDGAPAAKAGLKEGDRIVAVNGKEVEDAEDLTALVGRLSAGDEAKIIVMRRDGDEQTITVTLGRRETEAAERPRSAWIDLDVPHEYRLHMLPTPGEGGISDAYTEALEKALGELLNNRGTPGSNLLEPQPYYGVPAPTAPAPSALRVQRSDLDRRLNDLAEEVKALRDDVQRLTEQLKTVAEKLDE